MMVTQRIVGAGQRRERLSDRWQAAGWGTAAI